jgi:hypothetical protein
MQILAEDKAIIEQSIMILEICDVDEFILNEKKMKHKVT